MRSAIILLIVLGLVSESLQQSTTGYVRKTDFIRSTGCTDANRIRVKYFQVNTCASNTKATYDSSLAKPFTLQYFSDSSCTVSSGNAFPYPVTDASCDPGQDTDTRYEYTAALAPGDNLYSQALYGTGANCAGSLVFFEQDYPICFLNSYGSYLSQKKSCAGTVGTTLECYDTACANCSTATNALSNTCDANSNTLNACGAPSSTSSNTAAAASSTPATATGNTAAAATGNTATATGTASASGNTAAASGDSSSSSDASSVLLASSVLVAAVIATLL